MLLSDDKRAVNIITDSNNWVEYETKYFVHCNLGWDGKCNAYYLSDIIKADFNTKNIPKQPNLRTITIGEYRNYQFNQEIIIGIRP